MSRLGRLHIREGVPFAQYATESTLRDALADFAHAYGWDATTEHHIPGWGRPDLYLTAPDSPTIAVEIKLALAKPAAIRRAFQQADVYSKALGPSVDVLLTAPVMDRATLDTYDLQFTSVWCLETEQFIRYLKGCQKGLSTRHRRAYQRAEQARREHELRIAALSQLSDYTESPLAAAVRVGPPSFDLQLGVPVADISWFEELFP